MDVTVVYLIVRELKGSYGLLGTEFYMQLNFISTT